MPDQVRWHKHHGIPGFPLEVGLQSVFDRGAEFLFDKDLLPRNLEKMVFRGHSDHTTDKVYNPAEVVAGEMRFMPFVLAPKTEHHKIEFHRKGAWAVAGRFCEGNYFGLSAEQKPNLFLAFPSRDFPNEDGFDSFPDTFILIEKERKGGEPEYVVIRFSSGFAKPDEFVVGVPVVVNWEIVDLSFAPDCIKKAVENRKEELAQMAKNAKNKALAVEEERGGAFVRRRGLTRM